MVKNLVLFDLKFILMSEEHINNSILHELVLANLVGQNPDSKISKVKNE